MKRALMNRKLQRVERALARAVAAAETPGIVLLAEQSCQGEQLHFAAAHGLAVARPERISATRETIFDLASLTKTVATATALMLLLEDGALQLDDAAAKYLPAFAQRGKGEITLRHLLSHSSGLAAWRGYHEKLIAREQKSGRRITATPEARAFVLDSVCRAAPVYAAGVAALYSDLDFIALGAIVETVSGMRLDEFCRERIFAPLQMHSTFFAPLPADENEIPPQQKRRIAATENCPWRGRILWGEVHDPNAWCMGGVAGHAGLFGSAGDLLRFARAWLAAWHGRESPLPQRGVREFSLRQQLPPGSDWALGWDTPAQSGSSAGRHFSQNSVGHLGFTGTSLWLDLQSECAVVMLANRHHPLAKQSKFALRPAVHNLLREAFAAAAP